MKQAQSIQRTGRRETHSSRAALSITVASVLLAVVLWLALELVLSATGNAALLVSPVEIARRTASLATDTAPAALLVAGVVLALPGLALVAAAVLPGAKPRHLMANPRSAVVADSEVLASAISRKAREAARLAPEQVTSSVGRKRVEVAVSPGSGRAVDREAVRHAVEAEVSRYRLQRPLTVAVIGARGGVVGA